MQCRCFKTSSMHHLTPSTMDHGITQVTVHGKPCRGKATHMQYLHMHVHVLVLTTAGQVVSCNGKRCTSMLDVTNSTVQNCRYTDGQSLDNLSLIT